MDDVADSASFIEPTEAESKLVADLQHLQLSVVVPARNEELLLGAALQSIQEAIRITGVSGELIVVNDASTDRTAEIARACGARVVDVELHNIGAVRNAGAAVATGAVLLFLDADTQLPPATLQAILRSVESGAVGGGAAVQFDARITWVQRVLIAVFLFYWQRLAGWAAGCCVFAKRTDFEEIGGFDVHYFAAEERYLSQELKKRGRFVVVREPVLTSSRKLRIYSTWYLIKAAAHAIFIRRWKLHDRQGLEVLYDAPRETE